MSEGEVLISGAEVLGVSLSPEQADTMIQYVDLIYAANEHVNLTRVPRADAVNLHLLDSLTLAKAVDLSRVHTFADIGTGAGFPGAVIKIAYPHIDVTLIDSTAKKLVVVEAALNEIGVIGWRCVHGRAEDISQQIEFRSNFDLITARAVAPMDRLAGWLLSFSKPTGVCIALKSDGVREEVETSAKAIRMAGGLVDNIVDVDIPGTDIRRMLVVMKRVAPQPVRQKSKR